MPAVRGLEPPRDLTIPRAGSHTARDILSLALRRLPLDVRALADAHPRLESLHAVRRSLDAALARDPGAVFTMLRQPSVGALLRVVRSRRHAEHDLAAFIATFAIELAARRLLAGEVTIAAPPPVLVLAGLECALRLPHRGPLRVTPDALVLADGTHVPLRDLATCACAIPRVDRFAGVPPLVRIDNNPLALVPGQLGNAVDLGGATTDTWGESIANALAVIRAHLPDLAGEFDLYVQHIVPIGVQPEKHRSASFHEALGAIYLGLHANTMTMVEALVHEFSHNKLHALMELDPVLENMNALGFRSPLRDDPRPLRGVLLALHAFLPVAELYRRMLAADDPLSRGAYFKERYAQIRRINREGADVVFANARPTVVGTGLVDEMRGWMSIFDGVTQPA